MESGNVLTIGRLAAYARVTVRAVRHYHAVGLLPEPERDASGYRSYDAGAVVRLVRIRTLAEAGVPLARVRELLDADPETFAAAVGQIDRELRARIRELRDHRRGIARLVSSDALGVPAEVAEYLDRLREMGAPEAVIEGERGAWILTAARWPESIPEIMADKLAQLADPRTGRLYRLIGTIAVDGEDEAVLGELAELIHELLAEAEASGELDRQGELTADPAFARLMDSFADAAHPSVARLRAMLAERGWRGWTVVQKREQAEVR